MITRVQLRGGGHRPVHAAPRDPGPGRVCCRACVVCGVWTCVRPDRPRAVTAVAALVILKKS